MISTISEQLASAGEFLDRLTGVQGSIGYFTILVFMVLGYLWASSSIFSLANLAESKHAAEQEQEEEEEDPPRNFTTQQLAHFDGTKDDKGKFDKPVYLSVNGTVFDVSDGRHFYGPDGPYEAFAGHECGVALAKMSFDVQDLDNLEGCAKLNPGEKIELDGWIEKFTHYRCYPIKGRLVPDSLLPNSDRVWTQKELASYDGTGNIPEGFAAAPIYLAASGKVYDMSFGGVTFYGAGGPYAKFAGRDASRALAKMSLDEADLTNYDTEDLTEKERKVLSDWIKTFEERKKYPIVGRLER